MSKKAVIISTFDIYSYNVRTRFVESYLKDKGYDVRVLAADFDHRHKKKYTVQREGLELIPVRQYKKNLSLARILSHRGFAIDSMRVIEKELPDLLIVGTPPNYLVKYASKVKRKYRDIKVIFSIGDMWPETLPVNGKVKKIISPVLYIWKSLRNNYIKYADAIIYECDLFKNYLGNVKKETIEETIYLTKEIQSHAAFDEFPPIEEGCIFVYTGSLNNIFDVDLTSGILNKTAEIIPVTLHIIGDGENKQNFKKTLKNVSVIDHGCIYDEEEKNKIYSKCHFALNLMKTSVFVGLTMKSVDYFAAGMPVINNISHDTKRLIEEYDCGFNYDGNNENLLKWIKNLKNEDIVKMKKNSYMVYKNNFVKDLFNKKMDELFSRM